MCVCAEFYPHGSHNTILSKDLSACLSCMLGIVLCEVSCANSSMRGVFFSGLDVVVQQKCSISMVVREGIESPRDKKLVLSGFSNKTTTA